MKQIFQKVNELIESENLISPIWPTENGFELIDQTLLPFQKKIIFANDYNDIANAIRNMNIRGSGAIGIAGAFGAYSIIYKNPHNPNLWEQIADPLINSRPTALILRSAIFEVFENARKNRNDVVLAAAISAADFYLKQLHFEKLIGIHSSKLIPQKARILTHCNSGALAGSGYGGRVLSVIRRAIEEGKEVEVFSQETRPYLQGAKITSWELKQFEVPVTLITDSMSGALMEMEKIDLCLVGSDRLAINGDLINKVGTYLIALAAREHNIPFYTSTTHYNIDPNCPNGNSIPIELRPGEEILNFNGESITVEGVKALYPAFDITPAKLINKIITELGIIDHPFEENLRSYINSSKNYRGR
jgi:methylthioribose-1-phosphate isomerase